MGCRVIITPKATDDLDQIVRHIALDSTSRARAFGHALLDKALSVGAFPEAGRISPEENDPAVREVIHGDYRIIYEIYRDRDVAYVLRFWHGARGDPVISRTTAP